MPSSTPNYALVKPAYTDDADIGVINGNMDILDATLDSIQDQINTAQFVKLMGIDDEANNTTTFRPLLVPIIVPGLLAAAEYVLFVNNTSAVATSNFNFVVSNDGIHAKGRCSVTVDALTTNATTFTGTMNKSTTSKNFTTNAVDNTNNITVGAPVGLSCIKIFVAWRGIEPGATLNIKYAQNTATVGAIQVLASSYAKIYAAIDGYP